MSTEADSPASWARCYFGPPSLALNCLAEAESEPRIWDRETLGAVGPSSPPPTPDPLPSLPQNRVDLDVYFYREEPSA
jgi:hypothetical protein